MSKKSGGGLQYVSEFSFPSDQGFTGSAGRTEVKGYMRGGAVKGHRNKPNTRKKLAKGTTRAAMGGSIGDAPGQQKMGFGGNQREINVDGVNIRVPRKKGGRAKHTSMHDKLMKAGGKMGYKQGGQVKVRDSIGNDPSDIGLKKYNPSPKDKNTSGRFKQKRKPMDSMDHGNQPARRGANARSQQDRESGGTGRLRPGLKKGGRVKKGAAAVGALAAAATPAGAAVRAGARAGRAAGAITRAVRRKYEESKPKGPNTAVKDTSTRRATRKRSPDKTKGKGKSRKGMPKNVKARGGKVEYSQGGVVKKG